MITGIPIVIRDAQIISSTVPYPDIGETLLLTGTPYTAGDTGSYLIGDLYHKFQCKQTHTSDFGDPAKTPEAYPDDETNAYWLDLGAVNKLLPFQYERKKQNSASSPYIVSLNPGGYCTTVAISDIDADSAEINVYDEGSNVVFSEERSLLRRNVYDYITYITAPILQVKNTLFTDLPLSHTNTITLTFRRGEGAVQIGGIMLSRSIDIGKASYDAEVRRENFSKIDRTDFLDIKVSKKRNIPTRRITLFIDKSKLDDVLNLIDELNGEITFWSGLVESQDGYFDSLFSIGFYRDFSHTIKYPTAAEAKIEIQEL